MDITMGMYITRFLAENKSHEKVLVVNGRPINRRLSQFPFAILLRSHDQLPTRMPDNEFWFHTKSS
jgi:hypothetical protein